MHRRKTLRVSSTPRSSILVKPSLEQGNFTLLEDFQLESQLAVNKSSKTPKGRADVEVIAKASPVKVNMNDEIYNHLVNIHR